MADEAKDVDTTAKIIAAKIIKLLGLPPRSDEAMRMMRSAVSHFAGPESAAPREVEVTVRGTLSTDSFGEKVLTVLDGSSDNTDETLRVYLAEGLNATIKDVG